MTTKDKNILKEFEKYKKSVKSKRGIEINLKEAQKKIRQVVSYKTKFNVIACSLKLPQCYVNKKVKVIVVK